MDNDNSLLKITLDNVSSNIKILNDLKNHFKMLLSENIISFNKFNDIMNKIKFLNTESLNQQKTINIINEHLFSDSTEQIEINSLEMKIKNMEINSISINDELIKIILDYGYISISSILFIIDKELYILNKNMLDIKLNLIDKYYQVINVEKKNKTNFDEILDINIKNILPEKHNLKNKDKIEFENDDKLKINLIYEINKSVIEIELGDNIYIFKGYFKEDTFNELYTYDFYENKYNNIQKKIFGLFANFDVGKIKIFYKEYMSQYPIKDFIILDEDTIANNIKNMYELLTKISKLSIIELLNDFTDKDLYYKRIMIILLLLDDISLDSIVDNFLNDNINETKDSFINNNELDINNDDENKIKPETKKIKIDKDIIIKNPLPLVKMNKITATRYSINSIMKNFDSKNEIKNLSNILVNSKKILNANVLMDFLKNSILKSNEYENFCNSIHWNFRKKIFASSTNDTKQKVPEEEITWEMKLKLTDVSEKAKDKVNEKIKEVRSSRDNAKAETFIENFFKIPFGKYIKEDIFIKALNSDIKMKKLISNINNYITEEKEKIHVSDSIEQIKIKSLPYRLLHQQK